jgi:NAD-dependent deacetylase
MQAPLPNELLEAVHAARHIAVLTGAGTSQESGIPTFRDAMDGMWAQFNPMDLATPEAFDRDPQTVARWYDARRAKCAEAQPNDGHRALAAMQARMEAQGRMFVLITQNVDRLHQAAGSRDVIELHGTLWVWRCLDCGREREERQIPFPTHPPRCECGGFRRPGVVWFGEMLPATALTRAETAARECDLFLSVGTSGVVYPAADLPRIAKSHGAQVAEINPLRTPVTPMVDWFIQGNSGAILPLLCPAIG